VTIEKRLVNNIAVFLANERKNEKNEEINFYFNAMSANIDKFNINMFIEVIAAAIKH